jgi:hypothetical protein
LKLLDGQGRADLARYRGPAYLDEKATSRHRQLQGETFTISQFTARAGDNPGR